MSKFSHTDKSKFEHLFGMSSGYVMDFSNSSFERFIIETAQINPYELKYEIYGNSKANRLRAVWQLESDYKIGVLLKSLLEYWSAYRINNPNPITEQEKLLITDCNNVVNKLLGKEPTITTNETDFLRKEFKSASLENLNLEEPLIKVLKSRLIEIEKCIDSKASLSVVFICGSVLEGILLGTAMMKARDFNQSEKSPKDKTGKVRKLHEWTLNNLIEVAYDLGLIGLDVKKYSHSLRDFRNYIHPYEQMASKFDPDIDTAKISWQVLKATISDLSENKSASRQHHI